MATFDALMEQGDPGALQDEGRARDMKLSDPRKLYDLWERQHSRRLAAIGVPLAPQGAPAAT